MAPAFLFVDPYGFKIPGPLLRDLMKAGRVELFINVMWRELDMLIQQRPATGTPHAQTLDEIFGSDAWRTEVVGDGMDDRLDRAIPLLARGVGAKWWTPAVRMVTGGQATRYVLLHLTNSDDGRDLIKECAWSVSPTGEFMVRRSDNPDQQFLIRPEPDLRPLRDWIVRQLSHRPRRWHDVNEAVRPEWWLPKHVNAVVRELKREGIIGADEVAGRRFGAAGNPLLRLANPQIRPRIESTADREIGGTDHPPKRVPGGTGRGTQGGNTPRREVFPLHADRSNPISLSLGGDSHPRSDRRKSS
jgi:hypothetical protein